jgi:hypothetical protein
MRQCGNCGKTGHNARTCGRIDRNQKAESETENIEPNVNEAASSVEYNSDPDNPYFDQPKRGLWVVSPARKRIAGKILYVKSTGEVVYENVFGAHVESKQETIAEAKYKYIDLTARHLRWVEKR